MVELGGVMVVKSHHQLLWAHPSISNFVNTIGHRIFSIVLKLMVVNKLVCTKDVIWVYSTESYVVN